MTPWGRFTPEQRRAAFLIDRPVLAAAGAGAGKTAVMAVRYVACLLAVNAEGEFLLPDRILALAFTREAAGNLRDRVDRTLRAVLAAGCFPRLVDGEGLEEVELGESARAHLRRAAEGLAGAPITTVDGFCLMLAAEHAAELGRDPDLGAPDELAWAAVRNDAWASVRVAALAAGGGDLVPLAAAYGEERVASLIQGLAERAAALPRFAVVCDEGDPLKALCAGRAGELARLAELLADLRQGATGKLAQAVAGMAPQPPAAQRSLPAWLADFANLNLTGVRDPTAKELVNEMRAVLSAPNPWVKGKPIAKRGSLACLLRYDPQAEAEALVLAGCAARLAAAWREAAEVAAARRGLAGFAATAAAALDLLERPLIQARLAGRWKHVLVDEAQDLNRLQGRLVEALSGATVFAVGDARQSIFGFRHAAPEIFARWRAVLPERGGAVAELAENFRSHPGLVAQVVDLVSQPSLEAAFEPDLIRPGRAGEGAATCVAWRTIPQVAGAGLDVRPNDRRRSEAQARRVASLIAASIASGRKIEEHAVLLRGRTRMRMYAAALEAVGIACDTDFPVGLIASQEVHDLEAILRLCLDPHDRWALAVAIGGPWGAADPADRTLLVEALSLDPAAGWARAASSTALGALVNEVRPLLAQAGPGALVRRLASDARLTARYAGLPLARRRLANLVRLAEEDVRAGVTLDAVAWLDRLAERRDLGVDAAEAGAASLGGRGVRLMTMHGAKGLEWPVVLVPELDARFSTRDGSAPLVATAVDDRLVLAARPPERDDDEDERPLGLRAEMIAGVELNRQQAEEARLFYVAVTRARDELHLLIGGEPPAAPAADGSCTAMAAWVGGAGWTWQEAPEDLDIPPAKILVPPTGQTALPALNLKAHERIDIVSVSELVEGAAGPASAHMTAGWTRDLGIRLGLAVHALLAEHGPGAEPRLVQAALAPLAQDLGPERHARLAKALSDPDLVPGYWSAATRLVEQPVVGLSDNGGLVHGIADLLLQDEDGSWRLYDWKTGSAADQPAAVAQIRWYAQLLGPHLGGPLTGAWLVDIEGGRCIAVELPSFHM